MSGLIDSHEATDLINRLTSSHDPGPHSPDTPWIAIGSRPDGSLTATASTMLASGVFWAITDDEILIGSDPGQIIAMMTGPVSLDESFLRDYAISLSPPTRTPYAGVFRSPPGITLVWPRGSREAPQQCPWTGPKVWQEQRTDADIDQYRIEFQEVLASLTARVGAVVSTLSGGLDSTFMVAGLSRITTSDEPVTVIVSVPLPSAGLVAEGAWDPDEGALADLMRERYPGRLVIRRFSNEAHVKPLAAAEQTFRRSWFPVYNPDNQIWLNGIEAMALEAGAQALFMGTHGNASFSYSHGYAATTTWGRLRAPLARARRWARPAGSRSAPLSPEEILGVPVRQRPNRLDRRGWLTWLAGHDSGLSAAANPATSPGVLRIDPYRSRRVMDLAASIPAHRWREGPASRGFARRAAQGWVPDDIRLRTRRGAQGWDGWYVIRNDRQDYLDQIRQLGDTTALSGWVDVAALHSRVASWPWGSSQRPPDFERYVVNRVLALGAFIRHVESEIRRQEQP